MTVGLTLGLHRMLNIHFDSGAKYLDILHYWILFQLEYKFLARKFKLSKNKSILESVKFSLGKSM